MRVKVKFREQDCHFQAKFRANNHTFKPSFQNMHVVDYTRHPVIQPLKITENGKYSVPEGVDGFNPVNVDILQVQGEEYAGAYEVVPSARKQVLETAQKVMRDNVTIKEIPYEETPNAGGRGTTVRIG